jgi:UDP-4-amino-4,6-dideoxy-N-acetyl-beta-L-altrosamine transaminase
MSGVIYPYGRQSVNEDDIAAVAEVMRGDWLTTGPAVARFERAIAGLAGTKHAVSFCNGTAALHGAMRAAGVSDGYGALIPPITFAATGNAAIYCGGTPIFADISPGTLCMSPASAKRAIEKSDEPIKVIAPVSFAGYPADIQAFREIAQNCRAVLIEDAAHALGAERDGVKVGKEADMTIFSFHPVKHITTAEGGMVTTDSDEYDKRLRRFREHGTTREPGEFRREPSGPWDYDMVELGYNYRLPDTSCALGLSQLKRLDAFVARRREIAALYRELFQDVSEVAMPPGHPGHAYHLFPVYVAPGLRRGVFEFLRSSGIGVQVHYVPLHLQSYYSRRFGTRPGDCPIAEDFSSGEISLPMYYDLPDEGVKFVVERVKEAMVRCKNQ